MKTSQLSPAERKALRDLLEPVMHYAAAASRCASELPLLVQPQHEMGSSLSWAVGEAIGVDWKSDVSVEANGERVFALVADLVKKLINIVKSEGQHVN